MGREATKLWKQKNQERVKELGRLHQRKYMQRGGESRRAAYSKARRDWGKLHKEKIKKDNKKYYMKNKQKMVLNWWVVPGLKLMETEQVKDQSLQIHALANIVADHYNIEVAEMRKKQKKRIYVVPRQVTMYLMKKYTHWSLKAIGEFFEGREAGSKKDHTTVIHAIGVVKDLSDSDPVFKNEILKLENKIHKRHINTA